MPKPWRRMRSLSGAGLAVAALSFLTGCGDAEPPPAAFGARPIAATRDFERALLGFDATRTKLFTARTVVRFAGWELSDVSTLELETGREELLAENVHWFTSLRSREAQGPLLILRQESQEGNAPATLTLLDPATGDRQDFDNVVASSIGWSDRLLVFIREIPPTGDSSSRRELWAGPIDAPVAVSGELYVHDWQFIGDEQLAFAAASLARSPPAILTIDLRTGETIEEFPAARADAEWLGAQPPPNLRSIGLASSQLVEGTNVAVLAGGCWSASEPVASGSADRRCYLLYSRLMSDGSTRAFVGLPDEHRELALPGGSPFSFSTAGPDVHFVPYAGNAKVAVWWSQIGAAPAAELELNVWDAAEQRLVRCPRAGRSERYAAWTADGNVLAVGDGGTMTMLGAGLDDCLTFDAPQSDDPLFSPGASRLVWPAGDELFALDRGDGSVRRVLSGAELKPRSFIDEDRLLALRSSSDGLGLIRLDLSQSAPVEQPIVEQVLVTGPALGARVLSAVHAYNAQDRTGKLSLLDLETLGVDELADSVVDYAVGWPPLPGATSFPFAYLKIGRFASARDGIWVGEIPREFVEER